MNLVFAIAPFEITDDQIRLDLPRHVADSMEDRIVILDVAARARYTVLLCQCPKLIRDSLCGVFAERDHRHWNRRARRHETDGVIIFVDVHEMNGGAKTLSEPLGGFDCRPGDLGEIDRNKNVFNNRLFHVFKLQLTASSDSAPLAKAAFLARKIDIFTEPRGSFEGSASET